MLKSVRGSFCCHQSLCELRLVLMITTTHDHSYPGSMCTLLLPALCGCMLLQIGTSWRPTLLLRRLQVGASMTGKSHDT